MTGIEWTDKTWNPTRGCSRVSEGCRHCYAEQMAGRLVRMGKGKPTPYDDLVRVRPLSPIADFKVTPPTREVWKWTGKVVLDAKKLAEPLSWRKPRTVFVNSMSDLFHEELTNEQIAAVFGVMAATPHITYQVLTKRARRMREWLVWAAGSDAAHLCLGWARAMLPPGTGVGLRDPSWPLPNVWLGVSVENQEAADERIPDLLATPAAVRFISAEPLIGAVDLDVPRCDSRNCGPNEWGLADDEATPWCNEHDQERSFGHWLRADDGIDWVIVGCESGTGARPCDVEWLRSLRDQCAEAEVPFFLKQAREADMGVCGDTDNPNGDNPCGERVRWHVLGPKDSSVACDCTVEGAEDVNGCPPVGFGEGSHRKRGGGGIIGLPYLDGVQHTAMPRP